MKKRIEIILWWFLVGQEIVLSCGNPLTALVATPLIATVMITVLLCALIAPNITEDFLKDQLSHQYDDFRPESENDNDARS